jgi:hypothetical protein
VAVGQAVRCDGRDVDVSSVGSLRAAVKLGLSWLLGAVAATTPAIEEAPGPTGTSDGRWHDKATRAPACRWPIGEAGGTTCKRRKKLDEVGMTGAGRAGGCQTG